MKVSSLLSPSSDMVLGQFPREETSRQKFAFRSHAVGEEAGPREGLPGTVMQAQQTQLSLQSRWPWCRDPGLGYKHQPLMDVGYPRGRHGPGQQLSDWAICREGLS